MNGILSTNNVVWQKEQPKYKGLLHKKITEPLDIIQVGGPPAEIVFILSFLADCWDVGSKVELKKIKTFSLKVLWKISSQTSW